MGNWLRHLSHQFWDWFYESAHYRRDCRRCMAHVGIVTKARFIPEVWSEELVRALDLHIETAEGLFVEGSQ